MSQLQTIKSNSRPTSPVEGSIFYETDTKRILVYAQGAYHIYNRDTLSSSTGGADDLHYPNGLYTNSEATYFLNTSPEVHLDTAHFNGVDFNGPDTPAVPNYTGTYNGGALGVWFDRTNNKHAYFRYNQTVGTQKVEERNGFNTFFGVKPTNHNYYRNDLNYSQFAIDGTTIPTGTVTGMIGDWTVFAVIGVAGSHTQWTWNTSYSHAGANHITAGYFSGKKQLNDVYTVTASSSTGPRLIIKRNDATNDILSAWGAEDGGATAPVTGSSTPTDFSDYLGFAASNDVAYELIFFPSALNIAEINTVKDYLQNKYSGAGAPHFPVGGTAPLTES